MNELVEKIKRSKLERFRTPAPFRENRLFAMSVGIGAKELCHAIWCILAISIHYDDGVAVSCLLNVYQPNGDCPLVAKITAQSQLRKISAQMAQMVALRLKGGAAGAGAGAAGAGGASGQGGGAAGGGPPNGGQRSGGAGAGNGAGGGGGRGDFQQIVNRLPASTLADFQKGDAVMVVSTQGTDAGGVTAITMLGGVEAILAAAPAGNASQAMLLSPWSLGGGAPGGDASGGNP